MSRLSLALAVTLACLTACNQPAETPAPAEKKPPAAAGQNTEVAELEGPPPKLENDNLLNLVFGAAVIERNVERSYEQTAAHAIDGTSWTNWAGANDDKLVGTYSLATLTRIRQFGITTPPVPGAKPAAFRIETSLDGQTWSTALDTNFPLTLRPSPRYFDVRPVDARYLRVTFDRGKDIANIQSLHALGNEIARYTQPEIEGCWDVNFEPARFVRSGARVTGTIGNMLVDGGTDGRVYRLMWLDKAMWGFAAVTVSPDGQHLSGVRWHEEMNPKFNGDGWIGQRVTCTSDTPIDGKKIVDSIAGRASLWRLYGVRFDRQDRIVANESTSALDLAAQYIRDHPQHRFRVVAREFRATSEAKNRARCDVKLAAVHEALRTRGTDLSRLELVNAGTARREAVADFTSQRVMDSGVELQVVAPR